MLNDYKLVPRSRLASVAGTSMSPVNRVIRELKERGLIEPDESPTGREHLTPKEAELVLAELGVR